MADVLKKFGRYFLLDRLAQGGMAEIYRARLATLDGAGRLIVIKRIQAGYDANSEFIQMFRSEIKVTMGFNHPNIVQLYDFGEEEGQPYIAMEFVDGKNVRQIASRFSELKQKFPIELAVTIIEQAASGLHYAHSFKDKITGQPVNIVHRDVSPQNILVSFEGSVKVIDFGIAKANTNSESTRAGVIKGKPSYLSPEQISGEVLDGRSDIFALGTVLWELLTGKKLFAGENDLAVLKLIESCQTHVKPPSTLNPKVPKELDYIVLKALAKQREKRFQSAEEMQRALHKFLYAYAPDFNPSDLAYYAKDLFKEQIVEDRKKIQRLNEEVERLLSATSGTSASIVVPFGDSPISSKGDDPTAVVDLKSKGRREAEVVLDSVKDAPKLEIEGRPGKSPAPMPPNSSSPRPSPNLTGGRATAIGPRPPGSSEPRPTAYGTAGTIHHPRPPAAEKKGVGFGAVAAAVAAVLAVVGLGPSFGLKIHVPYLTDAIAQLLGTGGDVELVLQGDEKGVTVSVNGIVVGDSLPAVLKNVPIGKPFRVSVVGAQGAFQQELTLRKGDKRTLPVTYVADRSMASVGTSAPTTPSDPSKNIRLHLNLTPCGGNPTITINGKPVDSGNPVANVPTDEALELIVERKNYHTFRREFVLDSKQLGGLKESLMDIALDPMNAGVLTVHTTPSAEAFIPMDGKICVMKTPFDGVKLPAGVYDIRLSNELLGMEKKITVNVEAGKARTIDERLELKD